MHDASCPRVTQSINCDHLHTGIGPHLAAFGRSTRGLLRKKNWHGAQHTASYITQNRLPPCRLGQVHWSTIQEEELAGGVAAHTAAGAGHEPAQVRWHVGGGNRSVRTVLQPRAYRGQPPYHTTAAAGHEPVVRGREWVVRIGEESQDEPGGVAAHTAAGAGHEALCRTGERELPQPHFSTCQFARLLRVYKQHPPDHLHARLPQLRRHRLREGPSLAVRLVPLRAL